MTQDLWLIWELTKRELSQRYRGTLLGAFWPVLYAGLFLGIFSFVFTFVLRVRWASPGEQANLSTAALMIFCGMVPYVYLAEILGRSPTLVLNAPNLVKRVRFPIHVIPIVNANVGLFVCLINTALLLGFGLGTSRASPWAVAIMPLLLVPLYLFGLGISWLLSSITVFFRDVAQIAPVIVQVMMFMAPVFYPRSAIPPQFEPFFAMNPLTYFVDAFRAALDGGFDLRLWLLMVLVHAAIAGLGRAIFQRLQPAFGDLL
jgi:lipopolysaccharide transport system permease protein